MHMSSSTSIVRPLLYPFTCHQALAPCTHCCTHAHVVKHKHHALIPKLLVGIMRSTTRLLQSRRRFLRKDCLARTRACTQVKLINERLRSLRGTARLAVDLVQPIRPEMARAFQYAFG